MRTILLVFLQFLMCLSAFAQSSIEYKATTIIPTEFNGIKIGTPNIGKQLLDKGFIYHDSNLYNHPDDAPWFINNLWQYIEVKNDLMIFYVSLSSFKAIDSESIKYVIWARVHSQLSPKNESFLNSDRVIKENCVYIWTDSAGNQLFLIFWKDLCSMSIVPANHSKPIAHSNNVGSHEYVDLGLSVKWATCNVGASRPEEYGDYYAWGEVHTKSDYDWPTYKWCNGTKSSLTKYNTDTSYGILDNKKTLDMEDDIAHIYWGGGWRMPTKDEMQELVDRCTWKWTTMNGHCGYKVTSKTNGNSIFLPLAGFRWGDDIYDVESYGRYWSSSLSLPNKPFWATPLYFSLDRVFLADAAYRCCGQSVRPVHR